MMSEKYERLAEAKLARELMEARQEVEQLRARVAELEAINQRRFISTMSFGEIQGDGTVKAVEYRHECTLCGATSAELELIEHETDCPLRAAGGDDARHS
jgi:hypothetical protein